MLTEHLHIYCTNDVADVPQQRGLLARGKDAFLQQIKRGKRRSKHPAAAASTSFGSGSESSGRIPLPSAHRVRARRDELSGTAAEDAAFNVALLAARAPAASRAAVARVRELEAHGRRSIGEARALLAEVQADDPDVVGMLADRGAFDDDAVLRAAGE